MPVLSTPELLALKPFIVSLAIGLLLGFEREGRPSARAGLRTFGLTALLGSLFALLSAKLGSAWPISVGAMGLAAMMVAANWPLPREEDPGTTTFVALLLCYGLGALAWYDDTALAVMLAVAAAVLLHLKTELHGIAARISQHDLGSVLQFAVLTCIMLPILPDSALGPYKAFNPYHTGVVVVLVAGVGLVGYAAMRLAGAEHGVWVAGVLGGVVSSTATTVVYSRRARHEPSLREPCCVIILLSNATMFLRLGILVAVLAPPLLSKLAPPLALGAAAATLAAVRRWRSLDHPAFPAAAVHNPTELPTALGFGLLYSTVLVISAGITQTLGRIGLYGIAFVTGLPDVDAASLSSLRLFQLSKISPEQAALAIGLSTLANLIFKTALAATTGRKGLALELSPGMVVTALAFLLGYLPQLA